MSILQLNEVSIAAQEFAPPLVDKVSFSLEEASILGICGRSGSGKTLLTQAILQLHTDLFYQGDIEFAGKDLMRAGSFTASPVYGSEIGYIPQDAMNSLNPLHRLDKAFALRLSLLTPQSQGQERILEVLELVGLEPKILTRYPHQISGGQQQRVIIALNLLGSPKLIIADEPTSSLDSVHQKDILDALQAIVKNYKTALIFISHSIGSLYHLSDEVLMLDAGRVCEQAAKSQFFTAPVSLEAQDFVQSAKKTREQKPVSPNLGEQNSPQKEAPLVELRNFAVPQYQERALGLLKPKLVGYRLAPTSFEFLPNRSYGIIGKSGSGKTSLGLGILNLCESFGQLLWQTKNTASLSKTELKTARASYRACLAKRQ